MQITTTALATITTLYHLPKRSQRRTAYLG